VVLSVRQVSATNRSQQVVFVNGRAIENNLITGAVREGYHTALMKGNILLHSFSLSSIPPLSM